MCGKASLSDTFTWASLRELFEEVEKSTETLAIMERSSVEVVGRSYSSSKAISYHLQHTDITLPPWPLSACDTGQREGQWRATVWLNWRKMGINFLTDSTNVFQTGAPKLQSVLHNRNAVRQARRQSRPSANQTHGRTHTYTTHKGCQTDRLADKECEGHSGGRGRHPGSKRWCTVSAHAKSVTISTHIKPWLSAAATPHNPQTIWLNLENKWRVSSYSNTPPNRHEASRTNNRDPCCKNVTT